MADPQPTSLPFFPSEDKTHDVDSWTTLALNSDALPLSQMYKISKVSHCKCLDDKKHEFLIIILRCENAKTFFVTDRGPGKPESSISGSYSSLPSVPQTPNSSACDISASKRNRLPLAKDLVYTPKSGSGDIKKFVEQKISPYIVLRTLEPSPDTDNMNAAQLAVLLRTVSNLQRCYDAFQHQCYWYANSVFCTIKSVTKTVEIPGPNADLQGKFHLLSVVKPAHADASKLRGELVMQSITHGYETVGEPSNVPGEAPTQQEEDFGKPSNNKLKFLAVTPGGTPDPAQVLIAYTGAMMAEEAEWKIRADAADALRAEADAAKEQAAALKADLEKANKTALEANKAALEAAASKAEAEERSRVEADALKADLEKANKAALEASKMAEGLKTAEERLQAELEALKAKLAALSGPSST